jgi:hypothetical protein
MWRSVKSRNKMEPGADQYEVYLPDRPWSLAELRPLIPCGSDSQHTLGYSTAHHGTERIVSVNAPAPAPAPGGYCALFVSSLAAKVY